MEWNIYVGCAILVSAISTYLVFDHDYEDGFIVRAALICLAIAEIMVAADAIIDGAEYLLLPTTFIIQLSITVFFIRHCYRFLRWRWCEDYKWRKAKK